jgi:glycosyltransferase involved in cell wall biosynthesis
MHNEKKILVSVVIPGYNESGIVTAHLGIIYHYLESLGDKYSWEIIFVNDGSKDDTGRLADEFATGREHITVVHHKRNMNLGKALMTGFNASHGDYIIVLDMDLSYSVDHIEKLLDVIIREEADIVIASPYMKGGKVTRVPFMRKILSRFMNRLIMLVAQEKIHTFTSMVRAYKREFITSLNLKGTSHTINPEIIYKGIILRARIMEIPAHLDWTLQRNAGGARTSSMKILLGIMKGLMSAFIFKPYAYFLGIGFMLLLIVIYLLAWIIIHIIHIYPAIQATSQYFDDKFSNAVAEVFNSRPHAFFIAGVVLIIALQFISLGFIALQNKRNFEETYHFLTNIHRRLNEPEK